MSEVLSYRRKNSVFRVKHKVTMSSKSRANKVTRVTNSGKPSRKQQKPAAAATSAARVKKALARDVVEDARDIAEGSRAVLSKVGQDYLRALVNTPMAENVGIPSNLGGYPGRTGCIKLRSEGDFQIGTGGMGFVSFSPGITSWLDTTSAGYNDIVGGPFLNVVNGCFSTGAFAGAALPSPQAGPIPIAQMGQCLWDAPPYQVPNINSTGNVSFRVVGCTLEVFPISSMSGTNPQNGDLILLELPGHIDPGLTPILTPNNAESFPTSRIIRGVQSGSIAEKIVVNWHPKVTAVDNPNYPQTSLWSDYVFLDPAAGANMRFAGANALPTRGPLLVMASGIPGTIYHFTCTVMYEIRGRLVSDPEPRVVDGRAIDLIQNALSTKDISGYVGYPDQVEKSYFSQIAAVAAKAGDILWKKGKEWAGTAASAALSEIGGFSAV